ncbi:ABC transporter ATP-binding protein [Dermatobacter hominis]|uniref:ABC transporter ATP-binding protein n=1 Tax=Dermatobacter hominis TaxID=2884263 RepID=UPI001D12D1E3|nr:ABC transporter ATP-binding protein [Dermatobacter hominis]UDY36100.1 ABC transporter ATP-binding protein [Dermatobacter hominis]
MTPPRLSLCGIRHRFGATRVLDGIDLEIAPGEVVALMGESGSGKTTLGRIVAGFLAPDAGIVALDGRTVAGEGAYVAPERRGVGVVPQEGALFPHLSVAGNVAFGLSRTADRADRTEACLQLVGLAGFGARRPNELSGGQQQRVAVARALAPAPRLVVLDEPFSGLDASLRRAVSEQVATALRDAGATALLITHDASEAFRTADRVAFLDGGQLVQVGSPSDLYERPTDLRAAYAAGTTCVVAGHRSAEVVNTPIGAIPVDRVGHVADTSTGVVVLRPSQLHIAPDDAGDVEVIAVRPDTDTLWATVRIAGEPVDLCTGRTAQDLECLTPGTRVRVTATAAAAFIPRPSTDS